MKSFFAEYSKLIGLLLLGFVLIILLSTPSMLFAKTITTIDTELSRASEDVNFVRAKMDFGNNEHMQAFPKQIGDWSASDYNTTGIEESLGADMMLMRAYSHPKSYQPVFFLIMQSKNRSSFHPPIVCYPALGYTIEEEGKAEIPVRNISWVEEPLFGTAEKVSNVTIPAKKLIVVKESKGEGDGNGNKKVTERRVVLYFYVKESPFTSDNVTMIRVSALAPVEGSYDGALRVTKEFLGDTIPCLFELRKKEPLVLFILLGSLAGKVVIGLLFLAPLVIIFYPQIKSLPLVLKRWKK